MPGQTDGETSSATWQSAVASFSRSRSVVQGLDQHLVAQRLFLAQHQLRTLRKPECRKVAASAKAARKDAPAAEGDSSLGGMLRGLFGAKRRCDSPMQAMVKSAARSIGSQVGREIIRGVLGSILGKR
jgi:hypothetical protein